MQRHRSCNNAWLEDEGNMRSCSTGQTATIKPFLEQYNIALETNSDLGDGSFSQVFRGTRISRHNQLKPCAIKVIDRMRLDANMRDKFLPRELSILRETKHTNIIRMHTILHCDIDDSDKVLIVTDLADGGDLLNYVMEFKQIKGNRAKKLFFDLSRAMSYIHAKGIAHRDLKGENVLLRLGASGKPDKALLTDFGFARKIDDAERSTTFCGSFAYVPPEVLSNEPYRPMLADCWSMGVILFIMLCAFMPFDIKDVAALIKRQKEGKLHFYHMTDRIPQSAVELLEKLMHPDPDQRLLPDQVKSTRWINETD